MYMFLVLNVLWIIQSSSKRKSNLVLHDNPRQFLCFAIILEGEGYLDREGERAEWHRTVTTWPYGRSAFSLSVAKPPPSGSLPKQHANTSGSKWDDGGWWPLQTYKHHAWTFKDYSTAVQSHLGRLLPPKRRWTLHHVSPSTRHPLNSEDSWLLAVPCLS